MLLANLIRRQTQTASRANSAGPSIYGSQHAYDGQTDEEPIVPSHEEEARYDEKSTQEIGPQLEE